MVTVGGTPGFKGGAKQTLSTRGSNRGLDPGDKQVGREEEGEEGSCGRERHRANGSRRVWEK
jgi:hypothetical protein